MAKSMFSLMGMYQYDNSILDNLVIPAALESKRSVIKDNLLMESAELEVLFPDFAMLKYAIGVWSQKELPVWQELYDTTQYEYNPIWNKDGTFTELETRDLLGTEIRNLTGDSEDSGSGSSTAEYDVFGYNSETAAHESKTTDSNTYSRNSSSTQKGTIDNTDSGTVKRERTEQGNIGVTSTQELIERQRAVVEFNIIDRIIKDFIARFCILVY